MYSFELNKCAKTHFRHFIASIFNWVHLEHARRITNRARAVIKSHVMYAGQHLPKRSTSHVRSTTLSIKQTRYLTGLPSADRKTCSLLVNPGSECHGAVSSWCQLRLRERAAAPAASPKINLLPSVFVAGGRWGFPGHLRWLRCSPYRRTTATSTWRKVAASACGSSERPGRTRPLRKYTNSCQEMIIWFIFFAFPRSSHSFIWKIFDELRKTNRKTSTEAVGVSRG